MAGRRIAITGATGFVGTALLKQLQANGVACVSAPLRELQDAIALGEFLSENRVSCLVHLAGPLPSGDAESQTQIESMTVELTKRCLSAVRLTKYCAFVMASTVRMFGLDAGKFSLDIVPKPFDGYGRGKLAAELLAREMACAAHPVTILRCSSICGIQNCVGGTIEARGLIPILVRCARVSGQISIMGTGEATKDLVHCEDCVDAFCAAIDQPPGIESDFNRLVFVGSGHGVPVKECAARVAHKVDEFNMAMDDPAMEPIRVVYTDAAPNDLAGAVDAEPAAKQLGWRAKRGLDFMIDEAIKKLP